MESWHRIFQREHGEHKHEIRLLMSNSIMHGAYTSEYDIIISTSILVLLHVKITYIC